MTARIPLPTIAAGGQRATRHLKPAVANALAIRDDGVLVPATSRILAQPNIRPYHGKPNATIEERLAYLAGFSPRRDVLGLEPFNMRTATKEEILQFMEEDYGVVLDGRADEETVRANAVAHIKATRAEEARRAQLAASASAEMGGNLAAGAPAQVGFDPLALPPGAQVVAGGVISGDEAATLAARAAALRDAQLTQLSAAELAAQEKQELAESRASRRGGKGIS